jgi:hypothetical protein
MIVSLLHSVDKFQSGLSPAATVIVRWYETMPRVRRAGTLRSNMSTHSIFGGNAPGMLLDRGYEPLIKL